MDYQTMTLAEIEAMPVAGVSDKDAHLYLWTINRYVEQAYSVARAWGLPTMHGFSQDGKDHGPSGNELGRAVCRLMTPKGRDWKDGGSMTQGNRHSPSLGVQVNRLPTTRAHESTESTETQQARQKRGTKASKNLTSEAIPAGGSLNPPWVEWLQGWPIGWTDCQPLETDSVQQWLDSHGDC